jgi:hypothetical protein
VRNLLVLYSRHGGVQSEGLREVIRRAFDYSEDERGEGRIRWEREIRLPRSALGAITGGRWP